MKAPPVSALANVLQRPALRVAGVVAVTGAVAISCAQTAGAEVGSPMPTVQASASDAAWLPYAPAPASPSVVCMVDSGVDPNPDTNSIVIGGMALSADTSTLDEAAALNPLVEPGGHPDGHGTVMAMVMAAPINSWGLVGIAPNAVRVYNMKALPAGQLQFPSKDFYLAIEECQRLHESAYPTMRVINLSLGGEPTPEANVLEEFKRAAASARQAGLSIVASAGDTAGDVQFPASYGPVLAVGAADAGYGPGVLCSFSSRGKGLDILAPGCDSITSGLEVAFQDTGELAFGAGASQASAIVSATEAAIDAYAPKLTPTQTEACLTSTTNDDEFDAAHAFAACGLEHIVLAGQQAQLLNITSTPPTTAKNQQAGPVAPRSSAAIGRFEARCKAPHIYATRTGREVRLRTNVTLGGCRLQARTGTSAHGRTRWRHPVFAPRNGTLVRLRAVVGAKIQARLVGHSGAKLSSRWVPVPITYK